MSTSTAPRTLEEIAADVAGNVDLTPDQLADRIWLTFTELAASSGWSYEVLLEVLRDDLRDYLLADLRHEERRAAEFRAKLERRRAVEGGAP